MKLKKISILSIVSIVTAVSVITGLAIYFNKEMNPTKPGQNLDIVISAAENISDYIKSSSVLSFSNINSNKATGSSVYMSKIKGIPVLLYHDIMTPSQKGNIKNGLVITTDEFDNQMSILHSAGYETINLSDLYAYIQGKKDYTNKVVAITFDDGYKTCGYLAAPILRKYGFRATIFIITKYLDQPDQPVNTNSYCIQYLSINDQPKFSDVLDYASHTNNMHNDYKGLPMIISEPQNAVISDLELSRKKLGDTTFFAYPFGKFNDTTISLLKQVGFTAAFTTKCGYTKPGMDSFRIPRFEINAPMTNSQFKVMLGI